MSPKWGLGWAQRPKMAQSGPWDAPCQVFHGPKCLIGMSFVTEGGFDRIFALEIREFIPRVARLLAAAAAAAACCLLARLARLGF